MSQSLSYLASPVDTEYMPVEGYMAIAFVLALIVVVASATLMHELTERRSLDPGPYPGAHPTTLPPHIDKHTGTIS